MGTGLLERLIRMYFFSLRFIPELHNKQDQERVVQNIVENVPLRV